MRLVGSRWLSMPKMMQRAWPQVMAIPLPENDTLKAFESCFTKTHYLDMSSGFKLPCSQSLSLKSQVPKQKNLVLPTLWLYSFCWRFFNSDMVIQHKTSPLLFRDRIEIHTLQHTSIQGTVAKLTPVYVHQDLLRRILIRILANPPDREIPKFWTFFFRHHEFDLFLTHGTKKQIWCIYNCYLTVWSLLKKTIVLC